jgi:hypothetical protein
VASDVFLGLLLADVTWGNGPDADVQDRGWDREVVGVATATNPADRFPDVASLPTPRSRRRSETPGVPAPRKVRRNPYKGLAPFDEADHADFYGREDVVTRLAGRPGGGTTVWWLWSGPPAAASRHLVMAGLLPELRAGALPGSDEWSIVTMARHRPVRGVPPRFVPSASGDSAQRTTWSDGSCGTPSMPHWTGPVSRALLVVDQFEELFSSAVDDDCAAAFLDGLVDVATGLQPAGSGSFGHVARGLLRSSSRSPAARRPSGAVLAALGADATRADWRM